jgi:hypothetical protein
VVLREWEKITGAIAFGDIFLVSAIASTATGKDALYFLGQELNYSGLIRKQNLLQVGQSGVKGGEI